MSISANCTTTTTMTTTIVSCFIKLYEADPFDFKTPEWRVEQFRKIARTGIPICLYGCSHTMPFLLNLLEEFPNNIKIMSADLAENLIIYKHCISSKKALPKNRNIAKDTPQYMALMNSKIEFVYDTMQKNYWGTDNFAWLDFSSAYLFTGGDADAVCVFDKLREICSSSLPKNTLYIPGCWDGGGSSYNDSINWRFCGTFFIGDAAAISNFYHDYLYYFPLFLECFNTLVWETNFWAWLESYIIKNGYINYIQWYNADHNNSLIINFSA